MAAEPVIEEGEVDEEIAKVMVEGVEREDVEGEVGGNVVEGIVVGEIVGEEYIVVGEIVGGEIVGEEYIAVEVNLGASEEVVGKIVGSSEEEEGEVEEGQLISSGISPQTNESLRVQLPYSNFPIADPRARPARLHHLLKSEKSKTAL